MAYVLIVAGSWSNFKFWNITIRHQHIVVLIDDNHRLQSQKPRSWGISKISQPSQYIYEIGCLNLSRNTGHQQRNTEQFSKTSIQFIHSVAIIYLVHHHQPNSKTYICTIAPIALIRIYECN